MLNLVALLQSGGSENEPADSTPSSKQSAEDDTRTGSPYELHYMIAREDHLSAGHIKHPGPIHRVTRPRGKSTSKVSAAWRTILAAIQSLVILIRVRPTAVISDGPAIAVPVSILGKLLGARIIYLESSSRISRPSLTGRILYRWADLFFVQWQQLQACYPQAIFAGRLV